MMPDDVKLFEVFGGLLREVAPEQAVAARTGRRFSRTHTVIDILWTQEQEAEADAEAAAAEARAAERAKRQQDEETAAMAQRQALREARDAAAESAADKLRAFGLSEDEIKLLVGK